MRAFLIVVTACVLSGCGGSGPAANVPGGAAAERTATESSRLTAYLDAEYEKELAMNPEELTSQGRKEQYDRLDDYSEEGEDRLLAWRRKSDADMKALSGYNTLDPDARTSYDIWSQALYQAERRHGFRRHAYIFVRGGAHPGFPQFLINFHRVDDRRDMDAYIARLDAMKVALDQLLTRAKPAAADGIRPPAFAYEQAIDEMKRITTGAPFDRGPDSGLFADAKAKFAALQKNGKIGAEADALTARATKALIESVKPAYDEMVAWLEMDREERVRRTEGCSDTARRRQSLQHGALPANDDYDDYGDGRRNSRRGPSFLKLFVSL